MNTFARISAASLGLACCMVHAGEPDPGDHTDLILTTEHAQGRYAEAPLSRQLSVPLTWRRSRGPWTTQVEVPWVRSEGVGVLGQLGTRSRQVESGLGDIWLKGSYEWQEAQATQPGVDLTLKLKLPTGSLSRGLGSGGTDVALQVELTQPLGALTTFGHLGYRRTGDVAGQLRYRDPAYAEFGLFGKVQGCDVGAFHSYRQAITALGALSELTTYVACTQGSQRFQLYASRGFTRASAEFGLGISVRQRF